MSVSRSMARQLKPDARGAAGGTPAVAAERKAERRFLNRVSRAHWRGAHVTDPAKWAEVCPPCMELTELLARRMNVRFDLKDAQYAQEHPVKSRVERVTRWFTRNNPWRRDR